MRGYAAPPLSYRGENRLVDPSKGRIREKIQIKVVAQTGISIIFEMTFKTFNVVTRLWKK